MDGIFAELETDLLLGSAIVVGIVLVPVVLFVKWRRHGSDPISQARADWYGGMFKSLLWVAVGATLTAATYSAASSSGGTYAVFWGMMLIGGVTFLWRAGRYFFRAKPQLDLLEAAYLHDNAYNAIGPTGLPARRHRGWFWWVSVIAIGYGVLSVGARVLNSSALDPLARPVPTASTALDGSIGGTRAPSRSPEPTPTRAPQPTRPASDAVNPAPVVGWGFVDDFESGSTAEPTTDDEVTTALRGGRYAMTVHRPGVIWSEVWLVGSGQRDAGIRANIAATSGQGAVALIVEAEDDSYRWAFLVDPGAQEWWVERFSEQRGDFFVWVEPRSYSSLGLGPLRSVELQVVADRPSFVVNGRHLAPATGVELESTPGSVRLGFGAWGEGFTVEFDRVQVDEV